MARRRERRGRKRTEMWVERTAKAEPAGLEHRECVKPARLSQLVSSSAVLNLLNAVTCMSW